MAKRRQTEPLISCVMATRNRRRFLPQALRCFQQQKHGNAELIVVDDSDRSMWPLCKDIPGLKYLRLTRPVPLGTKLNLGIEAAAGNIIQKLDDDDYYGPEFLGTSFRHLPPPASEGAIVTRCCFLLLLQGSAGIWHSGHGWTPGGAFCFHRSLWERRPFRDIPRSEDSYFLHDLKPRIIRICDVENYIVVRHGTNTWKSIRRDDVCYTVEDFFSQTRELYEKPLEAVVPPADAANYRRLLRW